MDTVTIFSRIGKPLDELNVTIPRHYKLDHTVDVDRGSFTIPVSDPKANSTNLARNNFVYITSDQPGIQPACFIMWPDDSTGFKVNESAEYVIPLRSSESLLSQRLTNVIETINIPVKAGRVFIAIMKIAQRSAPIPVLSKATDNIDMTSPAITQVWNLADCLSITNALASDSQMYWGFTPSRDWDANSKTGSGRLVLTPFFRPKVGKRHTANIIASSGGGNANDAANLIGSSVEERSYKPYANRIVAYGKMNNWKGDNTYVENDLEGQSLHGIVSAPVPFLDVDNKKALMPKAKQELDQRKSRLYVDGTLINTSDFPSIGDVCLTQPDYQGATVLSDRFPSILRMRVKETNYNPQNNTMAVSLESLRTAE